MKRAFLALRFRPPVARSGPRHRPSMNGELAQAMALVAHGSAWLQHPDTGPPPSLAVENSTFRYFRSASFVTSTSPTASATQTTDAAARWLQAVRHNGVDRPWLATHNTSSWSSHSPSRGSLRASEQESHLALLRLQIWIDARVPRITKTNRPTTRRTVMSPEYVPATSMTVNKAR